MNSPDAFPLTDRNRVRRYARRGRYDRETIYAILDEGMVCHVAFVQQGRPMVIPTLYARRGDTLLLHGAVGSNMLWHIGAGHEVAVSVALVDGLVVTKAVGDLSVNYRSVVLFGHGRLLEDLDEKRKALYHLTERLMPGHWREINQPDEATLRGVAVAEIAIEIASAKIRTCLPDDEPEARTLPVWAGYVPIAQVFGKPITADYAEGMSMPDALRNYLARRSQLPSSFKE
jgi:nitroimidazol reductase NimA-like FMN-containing flavoprotein (pyridoxamine 5'-phosphate oxidase superfamily)